MTLPYNTLFKYISTKELLFMRRFFALFLILAFLCPVVRGAESPKYVALTFDDGPSGRFTKRLLEGLEARKVKATFLLCGYRLQEDPKLAQAIQDGGHEIGLHGFSHRDMSKMTQQEAAKEIADTYRLLPKGCKPTFLRPPGGAWGGELASAARAQGLALLNWSVDPQDWINHDAKAVQAAVMENIQDGDIILLHDMCDCSVDAALAIVDALQAQGFRFVTVSQLAMLRGITPKPGVMYTRFR